MQLVGVVSIEIIGRPKIPFHLAFWFSVIIIIVFYCSNLFALGA